jgi:hypothetical protein
MIFFDANASRSTIGYGAMQIAAPQQGKTIVNQLRAL